MRSFAPEKECAKREQIVHNGTGPCRGYIGFITLSFLLGLLLIGVSTAMAAEEGDVLTVGPGDGADFTTIQAAVDAASDGDTIRVPDGTYNEDIDITKEVTIEGTSTSGTVITSSSFYTVVVNSDYVDLKKLTIKYTGPNINYAAVYITTQKSIKIDNCVITSSGIGVFAYSSDLRMRNTTIHDCSSYGLFIDCYDYGTTSGNIELFDCIVKDGSVDGIWANMRVLNANTDTYTADYDLKVSNSTIKDNAGAAIYLRVWGSATYWHQKVNVYLDAIVDSGSKLVYNKYGVYTSYHQGPRSTVRYSLKLLTCEVSNNTNYGLYLDNIGVQEDSAVLRDSGVTDVRGDCYTIGDWTWHAESTYLFNGEILINLEDTVTVEAGTTVNFDDDRGSVRVEGYLVSNGTEAKPVTFTNSDNTASGLWLGIILHKGTNANGWDHIIIRYATRGITLIWNDLHLNNSKVERCTEGIYMVDSRLYIKDCDFDRNQKGIWVVAVSGGDTKNALLEMENSRLSNNTEDGMEVWLHVVNGYTGIYDVNVNIVVNGSVIENNRDKGFDLDVYGAATYHHQFVDIDLDTYITNSTLYNNKHGVYTLWSQGNRASVQSFLHMDHNKVLDNSNTGISGRDQALIELTWSTIQDNDVGLELRECPKLDIRNNTFTANRIGIRVRASSADPELHQNLISKNTEFGVEAEDHTGTVDATYNWWGHGTGPYNARTNPLGKGNKVTDNVLFDPYTFGEDMTPTTATTGDHFTFDFKPFEFIGLTSPNVTYWYGTGAPTAEPMKGRTQLTCTITIPWNSTDPLYYRINGTDRSGETAESATVEVLVLDNDAPCFDLVTNPAEATTGDPFTFSIDIQDNIGVHSASVDYWFDSGDRTNTSLELDGTYKLTVDVPVNSTEPLHYVVHANDTSDNWNWTTEGTVPVMDNDAPDILSDGTPKTGTTGDPITFSVEAGDNIGVSSVMMEYWYGEGEHSKTTLEGDGPYEKNVWLFDYTVEPLHYVFHVGDAADNWATSVEGVISITDNDPPEFFEDLSAEEATTGDRYEFLVRIVDNIGASSVTVEYWSDDIPRGTLDLSVVDDTWSNGIDVPGDSLVEIHYFYNATDLSGNFKVFEELIAGVVDNDPPAVTFWPGMSEVVLGSSITLTIHVEDNIATASAKIHYWYDNGAEQQNEDTSVENGSYAFTFVVSDVAEIMHFYISVTDERGNTAETETYDFPMVNCIPRMLEVPKWKVTEERLEDLDLTDYIVDTNADKKNDIVMTCNHPAIDVVGLALTANYAAWVEDHEIEVTISDGKDESVAYIQVTVVNVNDGPEVLTVLPEDKASFKSGEKIEFTATASDEDGDDLTYTWIDGEKMIGNGRVLEHSDLSSGWHEIMVRVSDGTSTDTEVINIKIEEAEDTPGFGAMVALLGVVTSGMVAVGARRMRG